MAKKILSYYEMGDFLDRLCANVRRADFSGVYGPPRGGLILAVALSHRLGVPLLLSLDPNALWVDDIVDSGATLKINSRAKFHACWVARKECGGLYVGELSEDWIVFPWEVIENADADKDSYALSRQ